MNDTGAPRAAAGHIRTLCIVLHDVAPATQAECEAVLARLAAIGRFPVTLLAVPRYHGEGRSAPFENWLRERAAMGDEVALHGFTHHDALPPRGLIDRLRRRWYTRGEGEFAALSPLQAQARIRAGLAWLNELDIRPDGFVAPAWLIGAGTWQALGSQRFGYTCTLRRLVLLPEARSLQCQGQVFSTSAAWRRALSLLWNPALAWWQRRQPVVRIELHPPDVRYPAVRACWEQLVREQSRGRQPQTLGALAQQLRTGPVPSAP
jgi:predicted deacetylase